jgi:hypothetical protein
MLKIRHLQKLKQIWLAIEISLQYRRKCNNVNITYIIFINKKPVKVKTYQAFPTHCSKPSGINVNLPAHYSHML